jgi:WD40 repeat protein
MRAARAGKPGQRSVLSDFATIELKTAYEFAFDPLAERLAYIGGRYVSMLAVRSGETTFKVHQIANLSHIDFSPDGKRLAVKSTSGRAIILSASTGRLLSDFRNQSEGEGDCALFSKCGRYVISVSWSGLFSVREWKGAKLIYSYQYPEDCQLSSLSTTSRRTSFACCVNRDPRASVGLTSFSVMIQSWPLSRQSRELPQEWTAIWGLQISPSGRLLAIVHGTPPCTLSLYNIAKQKVLAETDWCGRPDCALGWSHDEKTLVTNGENSFRFHNVPDLTTLRSLRADCPCFAAFSPSDEYLALGSWKKSFIISTRGLPETKSA